MRASEIDYIYYGADDDREITVTIQYEYEKGCNERLYGQPDDWHGAEGPEIGFLGGTVDGRKMENSEFARFTAWHAEAICEKIAEAHDTKEDR